MTKNSRASHAEPAARQLAAQMGFVLVDVELAKESSGWFLRFFIDRDGGVTLSDCERFHKAIQPLMEDVEYDYMEVASPGADRPLKSPQEFARAIGSRVEVSLYRPAAGAKRHTGVLLSADEAAVRLALADGTELALERRWISKVAPVIEFEADQAGEADERRS